MGGGGLRRNLSVSKSYARGAWEGHRNLSVSKSYARGAMKGRRNISVSKSYARGVWEGQGNLLVCVRKSLCSSGGWKSHRSPSISYDLVLSEVPYIS